MLVPVVVPLVTVSSSVRVSPVFSALLVEDVGAVVGEPAEEVGVAVMVSVLALLLTYTKMLVTEPMSTRSTTSAATRRRM